MLANKYRSVLFLTAFGLLAACASDNDIFPRAPVTTDLSELELPNPISVIPDTANNQIVIVNANTDFLFDQGTLLTVNVDATDPASPVLTPTAALAIPNYAGLASFTGTTLYVPFREAVEEDGDEDQIISYTVGAGTLAEATVGTTGKDPFGTALDGTNLLVVNNNELDIFDASLTLLDTVDLRAASDAGIDRTNSRSVENVAVDAASNRAFISNRNGNIFVVDLDDNTLSHVIDGPRNTRGIATDGTYIYAVDGNPPTLWIYDPSLLNDPVTAPQEIDDAQLLVGAIDLGFNPNGISVDAARNRAYVANLTDKNVSVIDLTAFSEIARLSTRDDDTGLEDGDDPFNVSFGTFNGTDYVFIANITSNNVLVFDATTLQMLVSFPE